MRRAPDEVHESTKQAHHACEHSVPLFWPLGAAMTLGVEALEVMRRGFEYAVEAERLDHPPEPVWATPNEVRLDLKTVRLRDFGGHDGDAVPVLVDAPFAGHSSTIADFDNGQSLVQVLQANGLPRVLATDWKTATPAMHDYDIDCYLSDLNVMVDDLGGMVHLVGLCQGGWLSTMYAARFPGKVRSLVLAGSPIDTDAGDGPIKKLAHSMPMSAYEDMVRLGQGLMPGRFMLAGWKNMHPSEQYAAKYVRLYEKLSDRNYLERTEKFASWYENPVDLPGAYYLQAISQLFKENRLAKGEFVALGRRLDLKQIRIPTCLMAGEADDITTPEQVFGAEALFGTPKSHLLKKLVPGGHIGLFMGRNTLRDTWPGVGAWIAKQH